MQRGKIIGHMKDFGYLGNLTEDAFNEKELDISVLDYVSVLLGDTFTIDYGMLPPSFLADSERFGSEGVRSARIPSHVFAVQIHHVDNHCVVSCQEEDFITIYDSLEDSNRLSTLSKQLRLVYNIENDDMFEKVRYVVPQKQGFEPDCGPFAIINAYLLLSGGDPRRYEVDQGRIRTFLENLSFDSPIDIFSLENIIEYKSVSAQSHSLYADNRLTTAASESYKLSEEIAPLQSRFEEQRTHKSLRDKLIKFVALIRMKLKDPEMVKSFRDILYDLTKTNVPSRDYFDEMFRLLTFKRSISPHMCKNALRCIVLMKKYPGIAKEVYWEMYPDIVENDHLRVMVVGNHNVGKTTLVNQLCNISERSEEAKSAGGIEVKRCYVDEKNNWHIMSSEADFGNVEDNVPTVSVWDFPGRSLYYATYQFFLNANSVYLLVIDLSRDLYGPAEDKNDLGIDQGEQLNHNFQCLTYFDTIKLWIKSIYYYTKFYKKRKYSDNVLKRVILIGTFKSSSYTLHPKEFMGNYFDKVLDSFIETDYFDLIDDENQFYTFRIGNESTFDIVQSIRDCLINRHFFKSKESVKLNLEIDRIRGEKKLICDIGKCFSAFVDFNSLLQAQHDLCFIFVHDNIAFLDPNYLYDIIELFLSKHRVTRYKLRNGKLKRSWLYDEILNKPDFFHLRNDIVIMLQDLDFILKPLEVQLYSSYEEEYFIMPCMLPNRPNDIDLQGYLGSNVESTPRLCLELEEWLPPTVFQQLLATLVRTQSIVKSKGKTLLFKDFGGFELDSRTHLLVWCADNTINIKIRFFEKESSKKAREIAQTWKSKVIQFMKILYKAHQRRNFENKIPIDFFVDCPKCKRLPFESRRKANTSEQGKYSDELLNVEKLQRDGERVCEECNVLVKMQDALKEWYSFPEELDNLSMSNDSMKVIQYSHEAEVDLEAQGSATNADKRLNDGENLEECDVWKERKQILNRRPSDRELFGLVNLVKSYTRLAIELNIPEQRVDRIVRKYMRISEETVIFHILYHWKITNGSFGSLYQAMCNSDCDVKPFFNVIDDINKIELDEKTKDKLKKIQKDYDFSSITETRVLQSIAEKIGEDFWLLGIMLGIEETTIQRMWIDSESDTLKITRQILTLWNRSDGNLQNLMIALLKCKSDIYSIINILSGEND